MADQEQQPADPREDALPEIESPDFDLSDARSEFDGNDGKDLKGAETVAGDEPDGIFDLFDREFIDGARIPLDPAESAQIEEEFGQSFEQMFEDIRSDDSPPLFDSNGEPIRDSLPERSIEPEVDSSERTIPTYEPERDQEIVAPGEDEPLQDLEQEELEEEEIELPELDDLPELEAADEDGLPDEPLLSLGEFELDGLELGGFESEAEESLTLGDSELKPEEEELDFLNPDPVSLLEDDEPASELDFELDPALDLGDDADLPELSLEPEAEEESILPAGNPFASFNSPAIDSDDEDGDLPEYKPAPAPVSEDEEDDLEEISFDDSDEDEIYGEDLSGIPLAEDEDDDLAALDEFMDLALGIEPDDDDDEISEDEDFKVEELSGAEELDPFEEISIMSSEDVAQYEPSFQADDLKFVDREPEEEDPDPFAMNEPASKIELEEELDPFGPEAAALAEAAEAEKRAESEDEEEPEEEKKEKPKEKQKKPKSSKGSGIVGSLTTLLLFPWRIYSGLVRIVFGLIESAVKMLSKIPILGIPFRVLGSVLAAIPMGLKKVLVLGLLVFLVWGGTATVNSFLPKPSAEISLPDSGGAVFKDVELKEGQITGNLENTGEIILRGIPEVQVFERNFLDPGSWFNPHDLGACTGSPVEIEVSMTMRIDYSCSIESGGMLTLVPAIRE